MLSLCHYCTHRNKYSSGNNEQYDFHLLQLCEPWSLHFSISLPQYQRTRTRQPTIRIDDHQLPLNPPPAAISRNPHLQVVLPTILVLCSSSSLEVATAAPPITLLQTKIATAAAATTTSPKNPRAQQRQHHLQHAVAGSLAIISKRWPRASWKRTVSCPNRPWSA